MDTGSKSDVAMHFIRKRLFSFAALTETFAPIIVSDVTPLPDIASTLIFGPEILQNTIDPPIIIIKGKYAYPVIADGRIILIAFCPSVRLYE